LYEAIPEGPGSSQLARLPEGMITAQVASVLARLGAPDQLASGPSAAGAGGRGRALAFGIGRGLRRGGVTLR
jgi:hypothetical protein